MPLNSSCVSPLSCSEFDSTERSSSWRHSDTGHQPSLTLQLLLCLLLSDKSWELQQLCNEYTEYWWPASPRPLHWREPNPKPSNHNVRFSHCYSHWWMIDHYWINKSYSSIQSLVLFLMLDSSALTSYLTQSKAKHYFGLFVVWLCRLICTLQRIFFPLTTLIVGHCFIRKRSTQQ